MIPVWSDNPADGSAAEMIPVWSDDTAGREYGRNDSGLAG